MLEKIICAAVHYKQLEYPNKDVPIDIVNPTNINEGVVFSGFRHHQCIYQMVAIFSKRSVENEIGEITQGFLTNKNRFVNREEAYIIADFAMQILPDRKREITGTKLFSEHLY